MHVELSTPATPAVPRGVWMLATVAFVVALGFGIVVPAISLFAHSFGVGRTAVGLAVSAFAFARFVSGPLGGRAVERFGERPVLVAGLLLVAVTSGVAGFAGSFGVFVLLRAAGGLGSAAFTVSAFSLLLRIAPEQARARSTATMQGGFLLGGTIGPGIGGFLTDVAPWLPFVAYGVFLLIAAGVAVTLLPQPSAAAARVAAGGNSSNQQRLREARSFFTNRAFVVALVANVGVGWMLFGVRNSLLTLYVTDIGGTAGIAGGVLLLGALAQALTLRSAGRVADVRGRRPAIVTGSWVAAAAVALLAVPLTGTAGLIVTAAAMTVFGAGAAFLASAPGAVVGDIGRSGTRVAVFGMASDLGAIAGPLVAGALADVSGYSLAFGCSAAVLAVAGFAALRMPETRGGSAAVTPGG